MRKSMPVLLGAIALLGIVLLALRGPREPQPTFEPTTREEPALESAIHPRPADQPAIFQEQTNVVEVEVAALENGFVEGYARDEEGRGVPQTQVKARVRSSVQWWNAQTGQDGHYRVGPFEEPVLLMSFQHEKYIRTSLTNVPVGMTDADVVMRLRGGISGVVLDNKTGEPIADFGIAVGFRTGPEMPVPGVGRTKGFGFGYAFADPERFQSETGEFRVAPEHLGKLALRASGLGHVEATVYLDQELRPGEEIRDVKIRLARGASIRGTVLAAATSEPVVGATVHWRSGPNGLWADAVRAVTDGDGTFVILDLKPGRQFLGAKHPDFAPSNLVSLELKEEQEEQVTIRLEAGGTIVGYVTVNGKGEGGVQIRSAGPQRTIRNVTTDENGYYELGNSAAGTHVLTVTRGRDMQGGMVEVEPGRTTQRDFHFQTGQAVIEGYVTVNGEPARGPTATIIVAPVWADLQHMQPRTTGTDEEGFYHIDDLAADTYGIHVQVGHMSSGGLVRVRDREVARIDLNIAMGTAGVRGAVSWPEQCGKPIVFVRDASDTEPFSTDNLLTIAATQMLSGSECKADGSYELTGLPAGSYNVTAFCFVELGEHSLSDIMQASKIVTVEEGEVVEVSFEL